MNSLTNWDIVRDTMDQAMSLPCFSSSAFPVLNLDIDAMSDSSDDDSILSRSGVKDGSRTSRASSPVSPLKCLSKVVSLKDILLEGYKDSLTEIWSSLEKSARDQSVTKAWVPRGITAGLVVSSRNRYRDIPVAFKTRIKLLEPPCSDNLIGYIHANTVCAQWLPGITTSYIATQGPLRQSIEEFWMLVWESRSTIVLMLTKLIENGRCKCIDYWPSRVGGLMAIQLPGCGGAIEVRLCSKEILRGGDIEVRTLIMHHAVSGRDFEVTHIQYMAWGDHSTPMLTSFTHLLQCLNRFQGLLQSQSKRSPLLVHCSAGIGRTGTFIMIDIILKHSLHLLKGRNPSIARVDIPSLLYMLRSQRIGLVQTKSQYQFIFDYIRHCLKEKHFGLDISDPALSISSPAGTRRLSPA